jgi:hypothetical protein
VVHDNHGARLEIYKDGTWQQDGLPGHAVPAENNTALWAKVPEGDQIGWRAVLETSDPMETPRIKAEIFGGVAVKWDVNTAPEPPVIVKPSPESKCYNTTAPLFEWTFIDADPGHIQSQYQLLVHNKTSGELVYDSGEVHSSEWRHQVAHETRPERDGRFWRQNEYRYTVAVSVWDNVGVQGDYCDPVDFCIKAFERPRITFIASVPKDEPEPDPDDPVTHLMILPGMGEEELPLVKAGAKVRMLVDSVGPLDEITASFPYLARVASTSGAPSDLQSDNFRGRFIVEFWTAASLSDCPSGTVVHMDWLGTSDTINAELTTPQWADGAVVTQGSIYEDWSVVLQGRD